MDKRVRHQHYLEYRMKLRFDILQAYGSKCVCCGENKDKFLSIDHVNGGGRTQCKELKTHGGYRIYSWIRQNNYPKDYQILCYNCNCGRARNNGVCPHKES